MAKTLFETIGHRLGQKVAQAKNAFDLIGGTEEDSLHAEIRLGRDLEAALLERIPLVWNQFTSPVHDPVFRTIQISTEMGLHYPAAPTKVIATYPKLPPIVELPPQPKSP